MSFFEPPQRPERPPPQRPAPWHAPPENELGVAVPLRLVLAQTDELVVALTSVVSYSSGFGFTLALRVRPDVDFDPHAFFPLHARAGEGGLRLGIAFADGRKATGDFRRPPGQEPPAISLRTGGGGGGGGRSFELRQWVYPLPPPGTVTFAVEWPARGIRETTREIDAAPILEAGARSDELWPDERPVGDVGGAGGSFVTQVATARPPGAEPPAPTP